MEAFIWLLKWSMHLPLSHTYFFKKTLQGWGDWKTWVQPPRIQYEKTLGTVVHGVTPNAGEVKAGYSLGLASQRSLVTGQWQCQKPRLAMVWGVALKDCPLVSMCQRAAVHLKQNCIRSRWSHWLNGKAEPERKDEKPELRYLCIHCIEHYSQQLKCRGTPSAS